MAEDRKTPLKSAGRGRHGLYWVLVVLAACFVVWALFYMGNRDMSAVTNSGSLPETAQ